jgi:hypothetical protein
MCCKRNFAEIELVILTDLNKKSLVKFMEFLSLYVYLAACKSDQNRFWINEIGRVEWNVALL